MINCNETVANQAITINATIFRRTKTGMTFLCQHF